MNSTNRITTKKSTIGLHPKPCADFFHVNGFEDIASLVISDFNCISLLKKQITSNEHIAIDSLKKGVYIANIVTSTETGERKLVKR